MTSDSETLHRAFLDFAETVQSLKTYIARTGGEEEEEEEDPFAQLALETLTLWCSKVAALFSHSPDHPQHMAFNWPSLCLALLPNP